MLMLVGLLMPLSVIIRLRSSKVLVLCGRKIHLDRALNELCSRLLQITPPYHGSRNLKSRQDALPVGSKIAAVRYRTSPSSEKI